jgi:orotidine-5'-phosphate decarboxylase
MAKLDQVVIAALDVPTWDEARAVVARLRPRVKIFKVGLTLFVKEGRRAVDELHDQGVDVFLDLKLHDIPMQVAGAVANAAALGVRWLSLHTAGGLRMLADARAALPEGSPTRLLGISVLTSLDQADLAAIGVDRPLADVVAARAHLAAQARIHGLVCSPHEIARVRAVLGPDADVVTPGIRLEAGPVDDQKRVLTPAEALRAGASHLVIGRALTKPGDPGAVLAALEQAMEGP